MNIEKNFLLVCENVILDDKNKLSLIGTFNAINVLKLPAAHNLFVVANLGIKEVKKPIYKKNPEYVELTGYEKYSQPFHYEVYDCDGTILFKSDIVKVDFEYSNNEHWKFFDHLDEVEKKAKGQCKEWLNTNYPDWENDLAYWD